VLVDPALGLEVDLTAAEHEALGRVLAGDVAGHDAREGEFLEVLCTLGLVMGLDGCGVSRRKKKRVTIEGRSMTAIVSKVFLAVAWRLWWLAALPVMIWVLMLVRGYGRPSFLLYLSVPAVATLAGLALHESGHIYVARLRSGDARVGVLFVGSLSLEVARPSVSGAERSIAAAGPLLPGITGLVLVGVGVLLAGPLLTLAGVLLAVHILGILPFLADGEVVWRRAS